MERVQDVVSAFNIAGNAQGAASMLYAAHVRRIVDPIVGASGSGHPGAERSA